MGLLSGDFRARDAATDRRTATGQGTGHKLYTKLGQLAHMTSTMVQRLVGVFEHGWLDDAPSILMLGILMQ